jgi:hypothetical protein
MSGWMRPLPIQLPDPVRLALVAAVGEGTGDAP